MATKDEALHKALKVLNCLNNDRVYETAWVKGAINACEEALAQPAQEPVARVPHGCLGLDKKLAMVCVDPDDIDNPQYLPLYTHPAPLWQGLSDDEILEIDKSIDPKIIIGKGKTLFARAIEQALKEKNHETT